MGLLRAHLAAADLPTARYVPRHASGETAAWYGYYEGRHRA